MHKRTKEIRKYTEIPQKEIEDDQWSKPFHVGQVVELFGVSMRVAKIKRFKKQIVFEPADEKVNK
jgi:hypothetical protein